MKTDQLRDKIILRIQQIREQRELEEIQEILDFQQQSIYTLNSEQREAVNEGLEDYKAGRTAGNDQINQEITKWLKE